MKIIFNRKIALKDGGFPAESRYHKTSASIALGNDFVDWGGASKKRMNP